MAYCVQKTYYKKTMKIIIIYICRLSKQAGVLLLGTTGMIPAMKLEHMETACQINEDKKIYPFAYRTHTHSLGKVVSGYRVRDQHWTMLGKRDPLTPQMFYPVNSTEPIVKGDILAARCTMLSTRMRTTYIGLVFYFRKRNTFACMSSILIMTKTNKK